MNTFHNIILVIILSNILHVSALPHIVIMVADDLGYSDTSIYGDRMKYYDFSTPKLNELANDGIRFSRMYSQPVCSPSRTSIIAGVYPFRVGMQHPRPLTSGSKAHLPLSTPTIAEILSTEYNYETHHIGKWVSGLFTLLYCR